ncbi:MAG TPA: hypothetical protein VHC67_05260 [Gaiellaceae bacterium]|jgi:hypothetical protein|nr:hypothetical protein [Gaiellaceae bacterium]
MASRKVTQAQQRDRRAKIMLGVLGVVLLAVVGFEVPSFLGGSGTSAVTTPVTTGGSAVLADAPAPVVRKQLASFSRFSAKNPFHSLGSTTTTTGGATPPPSAGKPAGGTSTPGQTLPARIPIPPVTLGIRPAPTTEASKPTGPLVTAAVLRLNGVRRVVTVGSEFPDKHPAFRLVAVGKDTMWVKLLGGSLTNGSQTLAVRTDRPVQLLNRTASLRYLLSFLRVTVATPPPATTTPLTTTVKQASP